MTGGFAIREDDRGPHQGEPPRRAALQRATGCAAEELEPRRLLSAAPPGYYLLDTVSVSALGSVATGSQALELGVVYKVRATGTITIQNSTNRLADAEFGQQAADHSWGTSSNINGFDWGLAIGHVGSEPLKPWWGDVRDESLNPSYTMDWSGSGVEPTFKYMDSPYTDNSGSLSVEVFAPITIDSLTVTDREDAQNQVTATAASAPQHLSVFEVPPAAGGGPGEAGVTLAATFAPSSASPGSLARWQVVGDGASPAGGTFAGGTAVTLTPTNGNRDSQVQAWVDTNGNAYLDDDEAYREVSVHIVGIEIDLNDTTETNDDAVRLKTDGYGSDIPAEMPTIGGEVRLVNADYLEGDVELTLDNAPGSVGQVAFANEGQPASPPPPATSTRPVTLSATNPSQRFAIGGVTMSVGVNDVSIRAIGAGRRGIVDGAVLNKKGVTVFWFTEAHVTAVPVAAYAAGPGPGGVGVYGPAGDPAVELEAWASIQPHGLDRTIPQIDELRIGIVQNTVTVAAQARVDGVVRWLQTTPVGTQVETSLGNTTSGSVPQPANDYDEVPPLYDPTALAIPFGFGGASKASTSDSPFVLYNAGTDLLGERGNPGHIVAELVNSLTLATYNGRFRTWCVLVDTAGGDSRVIAPLRETEWTLSVRSDQQNQKAVWNGQDFAVANNPILGLKQAYRSSF